MAVEAKGAAPLSKFTLLVLALSLPFWMVGGRVPPERMPFGLPISALMAINPMIAALILARRQRGAALIRRPLHDGRRLTPIAYALSLLLMPAVVWSAYGLRAALPGGTPNAHINLRLLPLMAAVFVAFAYAEEIGWQGYLAEPLNKRWGVVGTSTVIGTIWAAWHIIPYLQMGRSVDWIAWQCAYTIALRIVIGAIYARTGGSLAAAIAVHASSNSAVFLIPNDGSGYDPLLSALIAFAAAGALIAGQRQADHSHRLV